VYRVYNVLAEVHKDFVSNGKLVLSRKSNTKIIVKLAGVGKTFRDLVTSFRQGKLLFPTEVRKEDVVVKGYKTHFGPTFFGGFVCYAKDYVENMEKALWRITSKRVADVADDHGYCDRLRLNQARRCHMQSDGSEWGDLKMRFFERLRSLVIVAITKIGKTTHECIYDDSQKPHSKLKLRVQAWKELVERGIVYGYEYMRTIKGKVKCPEWAKPGKQARLIGDYSTEGSLLGGFLLELIKHCFEEWYCDGLFRMRFVFKPNYETLVEVYSKIWEVNSFTFIYHSDDGVVSIPCLDGQFRANLDISSCDASNGIRVFETLKWFVQDTLFAPIVDKCVEQCEKTLTLCNPHNSREKIVLDNGGEPIEFSGTVLTTALNNIAMCFIALSIKYHYRLVPMSEMKELISASAEFVGYKVTIEEVKEMEELQFLKTSPYISAEGKLEVFTNLGVLLRSLGTCDGDLPGRGDIERRAESWNASVVRGYVHTGRNIVTDALRERFNDKRIVKDWAEETQRRLHLNYTLQQLEGFSNRVVPMWALCRRYRIDSSQLEYLVAEIARSNHGDVITCDALRAIFKTDYGISLTRTV